MQDMTRMVSVWGGGGEKERGAMVSGGRKQDHGGLERTSVQSAIDGVRVGGGGGRCRTCHDFMVKCTKRYIEK